MHKKGFKIKKHDSDVWTISTKYLLPEEHVQSNRHFLGSCKHTAFTLTEVLISLLVIGVAATLTLPALITKINSKVNNNQKNIIEKKFVDGLNLYNNLGGAFDGSVYSNTEEFLQGLSKYYKMVKICDETNIKDCIPYKEISYIMFDESIGKINITDIKSPSDLRLGAQDYLVPAAFISASGTPFVVSLKKNCTLDSDTQLKDLTDANCIAGFYDINGSRKPNNAGAGNDIVTFNGAKLGIFAVINGVKIAGPAFFPSQYNMTLDECHSRKASGELAKYDITECYYDHRMDYNNDGKITCYNQGAHMVTDDELNLILAGLYKDSSGNHPTIPSGSVWENTMSDGKNYDYNVDIDLANALGLRSRNAKTDFTKSINSCYRTATQHRRCMYPEKVTYMHNDVAGGDLQTFCVEN